MPDPRRIDFNCDLGEGCGDDAGIMPFINSASIACGGHAGDADTMRATVALCLRYGVAIGAHPSFEDRAHFGRRELAIAAEDVRALAVRQIRGLTAICDELGARLHHVKPHGALYNLAARDRTVADAIADAVREVDPALIVYGLAGSASIAAATGVGLRAASEVFAERRYEADGTLTPRSQANAVIEEIGGAIDQVRGMLDHGVVIARDGTRVPIRAETLCLHGDRPDAAAFARAVRQSLEDGGLRIAAP